MKPNKAWISILITLLSFVPSALVMICTVWLALDLPSNERSGLVIGGLLISIWLQEFFYKRAQTIIKKQEDAGKPPQTDQPQSAQTPAGEPKTDAPKQPPTQPQPDAPKAEQSAAKPRVISEAIVAVAKRTPSKELFFAADRVYRGPDELIFEPTADRQVYRDVYGRTVLYDQERFPCFDSCDYLYESRYYYRYVIKAASRFTVIEMQDDSDSVSIHEGLDEKKASWYSRISPVDLSKLDAGQNA